MPSSTPSKSGLVTISLKRAATMPNFKPSERRLPTNVLACPALAMHDSRLRLCCRPCCLPCVKIGCPDVPACQASVQTHSSCMGKQAVHLAICSLLTFAMSAKPAVCDLTATLLLPVSHRSCYVMAL